MNRQHSWSPSRPRASRRIPDKKTPPDRRSLLVENPVTRSLSALGESGTNLIFGEEPRSVSRPVLASSRLLSSQAHGRKPY